MNLHTKMDLTHIISDCVGFMERRLMQDVQMLVIDN